MVQGGCHDQAPAGGAAAVEENLVVDPVGMSAGGIRHVKKPAPFGASLHGGTVYAVLFREVFQRSCGGAMLDETSPRWCASRWKRCIVRTATSACLCWWCSYVPYHHRSSSSVDSSTLHHQTTAHVAHHRSHTEDLPPGNQVYAPEEYTSRNLELKPQKSPISDTLFAVEPLFSMCPGVK